MSRTLIYTPKWIVDHFILVRDVVKGAKMRTFVCVFVLCLAQVIHGQVGGSSHGFDCTTLRPGGPGLTMFKNKEPSPVNESSIVIHVDLMDRSIRAGQRIPGNIVYMYQKVSDFHD